MTLPEFVVVVLILLACVLTAVFVAPALTAWRTSARLRLIAGTRAQRATLAIALKPVVREFLPLLAHAGVEVRSIVVVPTLGHASGDLLAAELEQIADSAAYVIRLAHTGANGIRQPEEIAGALAEELLYLYRHAAAVTVVRQTRLAPVAANSGPAAVTARQLSRSMASPAARVLTHEEAEGTTVACKPSPLGLHNNQSA
jgi:hypothetical protein